MSVMCTPIHLPFQFFILNFLNILIKTVFFSLFHIFKPTYMQIHKPNTYREISDHTKSPELLNGRVKTLHPAIHAGSTTQINKPLTINKKIKKTNTNKNNKNNE